MKKSFLLLIAFLGFSLSGIIAARASDFTSGNLVVVQVGDGSSSLSSSATSVFLVEYTPAGSLVQTIALPTAASGANKPITVTGNGTTEGFLKLSVDGHHLTLAGYAATPGTASVAGTTSASVNRVVAVVNVHGAIDTTTAINDGYSGGNVRSVVSTDGTNFWLGGTSSGSSGGNHYAILGSTSSTQVSSTPGNVRDVGIFNGQLYMSASSGTFLGVSTIGSGVPTTAGQFATLLPGLSISSAYDFWFKDSSTLYVADDNSVATGGGIQKWTFDGISSWSHQYTLTNGPCRGLTGTVDGNGNAVLYATPAANSANTLITMTDTGSNAPVTILATAPTNTVFRGVAFAPGIPTLPSLGIASAGNQAVLFWPASATNVILQTTTNLSSPNWVTVSNGTPIVGVTLTNNLPAAYFRLQSQ